MEKFISSQLKTDLPDIRPGDVVRVHQKVPSSAKAEAKKSSGKKEGAKDKTQAFEGLLIARKHGREMGSTITVRRVVFGVGVEKIFPLHSPNVEKIEIVKRGKVRRAKLYYIREAKGKKAKLKKKEFAESLTEDLNQEKGKEETPAAAEGPKAEK